MLIPLLLNEKKNELENINISTNYVHILPGFLT